MKADEARKIVDKVTAGELVVLTPTAYLTMTPEQQKLEAARIKSTAKRQVKSKKTFDLVIAASKKSGKQKGSSIVEMLSKLNIDFEKSAVYIRRSGPGIGPVARTVEVRKPIVTVDLDAEGNVCGIEIIGLGKAGLYANQKIQH